MHDTGPFLVTQAYGIIKACRDDTSVSLYSSYCSFRSSLDLNVDLCSKNITTLEATAQIKADLMTEKDENNFLTVNKTRKLLYVATYWHNIVQGVFFPPLKGFIRFT